MNIAMKTDVIAEDAITLNIAQGPYTKISPDNGPFSNRHTVPSDKVLAKLGARIQDTLGADMRIVAEV